MPFFSTSLYTLILSLPRSTFSSSYHSVLPLSLLAPSPYFAFGAPCSAHCVPFPHISSSCLALPSSFPAFAFLKRSPLPSLCLSTLSPFANPLARLHLRRTRYVVKTSS
ncbi:hypothetical protein B0H12DRAFT_1114294 [Mycena haematopus]|nr:hypothetical protein B0H12DRAFT_1114294 [Mycena haematopus]